jgi:hypothetical protein
MRNDQLEIGLEHDKWKNLNGARLQNQLQTALILSDTFILKDMLNQDQSYGSVKIYQ